MLRNILILFISLGSITSYGQLAKSAIYAATEVPAHGFVSVFGSHDFTDLGKGHSIVKTQRGDDRSYFIFADGAQWLDATVDGYVDGYAKSYSSHDYVLPIGNDGDYRPVIVSGESQAAAAYIADDPNKIAVLSNEKSIAELSDHGYYFIESDRPTKFSITWNYQTDIERLVDEDFSKLGIVGFDGNRWVAIGSQVEVQQIDITQSAPSYISKKSNGDNGVISTLTEIDVTDYEFFTLARLNDNSQNIKPMTLSVYPNPAVEDNFVYVDFNLGESTADLLIGKIGGDAIISQKIYRINNGKIKIDTNPLTPGVYWVRIKDDTGNNIQKKLIILDSASVK